MALFKKNFEPTIQTARSYDLLLSENQEIDKSIRMHLKEWRGSRRYMTLNETDHHNMIDFLKAFNCEFTEGNDAPRGGALGDFIQVKKSALNKLIKKYERLSQPYPRKPLQLKKDLALMF